MLYAIALASQERPATVDEVIGAADYVNHAIMTFEEFDSALAKLEAAKMIVIRGGQLRLSADTKRLVTAHVFARRSHLAQWERLHSLLRASEDPPSPRWQDPTWRNTHFSRVDFEAAVKAYLDRFRRTPTKRSTQKPKRVGSRSSKPS